MARDTEYEALRNKYNTMIAKYQSLREKLSDKEQAWEKVEENTKVVDDLTRDLCKMILAKDPKESVTGKEYSWNLVKTPDLVRKAIESYTEYCKTKSKLYEETVDEKEKRGEKINSLTEQIEAMFMQQGLRGEDLDSVMTAVQNGEKMKKILKRLPKDILNAAEAGSVNLQIIEDDELSPNEQELFENVSEMTYKTEFSSMQVPHYEKKKREQQKKKIKTEASKIHVQNLADTEESMSEVHWFIIEEFGKSGASRWTEIKDSVIQKHPDISANKSNTALKELKLANIVKGEKISTPIAKLQWIYKLTDAGIRMFMDHFGQEPVQPEMERVRAEHDNYEHGYGILETAAVLEAKNFYDNVNCWNRDNPIELSGHRQYIPDITCKIKKRNDYYEYERGNHTQPDFNDKCNKMQLVSRSLTFVVPNKEVIKKIKEQVDKWITSLSGNYPNVKIRIATVDSLKTGTLSDDSCWVVLYNLGVGPEPVKTPEYLK